MFVLLFAFVFGGAIAIPAPGPTAYREYLMPGIFAQTIVFAAATDGHRHADDVEKGIVDRFRSLPMARSAVLTGRTLADVIYNAGILFVLMATGFLVGWRVDTGIPALLAGRRAAAAVRVLDVVARRLPRVVRADRRGRTAGVFTVLFPITFVSTAFVPLATLPPGSSRSPSGTRPAPSRPRSASCGGTRTRRGRPASPATQEPILVTLVWVAVLVAIFGRSVSDATDP